MFIRAFKLNSVSKELSSQSFLLLILLLLNLTLTSLSQASTSRIAAASNFAPVIKILARRFEQQSGERIVLAFGSTGKHYTQIQHGAPFDAFFAADVKRPQLLEQQGLIQPGSRFTYAIGQLALWSKDRDLLTNINGPPDLSGFQHIAIANPKLAPYGLAARQALQNLHLYDKIKSKLVFGENISQTYQFVASGNASPGFVAYSQLITPDGKISGSYWLVPAELHEPIEQQAVLLRNNPVARKFLTYIQSEEARNIIQKFGYKLPE